MLLRLERQTLRPSAIVISCTNDSDVAGLRPDDHIRVLIGPPGLPAQRNLALTHIPWNCEMVVFFDDDFIADDRWLESAAATFRRDASIHGVTGDVIADGINGPGVSVAHAVRLIDSHGPAVKDWMIDNYSPYGCNMAFRWSAARDLRFDERLVLYGWQEDRDFGAAIAQRGGRLVKIAAAFGVHLGAKIGRTSGRRLGYSQIANPLYLAKKGTMSPVNAFKHIACNLAINLVRSVAPEPYIDRSGRLRGNLLAMRDVVMQQAAPERAEHI
jgi:hypothetical protein